MKAIIISQTGGTEVLKYKTVHIPLIVKIKCSSEIETTCVNFNYASYISFENSF